MIKKICIFAIKMFPEMLDSNLTFNNMLCRVCARFTMSLYSLYENDTDGTSSKDKLSIICGLEVNETDDYPKTICKICRKKLKNFFEFRNMCLSNQEFLTNYNGMEEYLDNIVETNHEVIEETRFFIEIEGDMNEDDLVHSDIEQYFKNVKINTNKIVNKRIATTPKNNRKKTKNNKIETFDPNKKHKCKYCKKRFLTLLRVKLHMQRLHKQIYLSECKVSCPKCGMKFQQMRNLKRHLVYHNTDSYFGCDFCDVKTYSKKSWRKHIKIHDEKINIICKICNKTILSKLSHIYHMDYHHTKDIIAKKCFYFCQTCQMDFTQFEELEKHSFDKHCLKIPTEHDYLHNNTKNDKFDEVERNVEKIFAETNSNSEKQTLSYTYQNINASVTFKCNICLRFYKSLPDLKSHVEDCYAKINKPKSFMCDICGKCFAAAYSLTNHKAGHSSARPFICDICGQRFKWHNDLTNHKSRIHDKFRPYVCKLCGKRCGTTSTLKSHMRCHTGEKPYACEHCGAQFAQSASLKEHALKHGGGQEVTCPLCSKLFKTPLRLRTHLKRHNTQRTLHPCDQCGRMFTERSSVKKHCVKMHSDVHSL